MTAVELALASRERGLPMTRLRWTRPWVPALVIAGLVLAGCSAPAAARSEPEPPYAGEASRGKAEVAATADLAVVWVSNGCTGVLIGRRTVLSARHCRAPRGTDVVFAQDRAVTTFATAEVAEARAMPGPEEPAVQGRLGTTGAYDLQLLRLTSPVPASLEINGSQVALNPVRINFSSSPSPCAACTRHVGFGRVVNGQDNYRKHTVVSNINSVTAYKFEYGNVIDGTFQGACHGDSGGAGFTMVGPTEMLSGVIDAGDEACAAESWDVRTDRPDVRKFITQTLAAWQDCSDVNCPPSGG